MSREVVSAIIRGAKGFFEEAEASLAEAITKHGGDHQVEFPG